MLMNEPFLSSPKDTVTRKTRAIFGISKRSSLRMKMLRILEHFFAEIHMLPHPQDDTLSSTLNMKSDLGKYVPPPPRK